MIMDKKWILCKILSNGGGRMGFGGICVFYLKCRSQGKLSSWNSCGQTQMSDTSHGYKSRFSWTRLDGWRHLGKMTGEVYKSVQADKTQLLFSACASEYFGILASLSKYPKYLQIPLEICLRVMIMQQLIFSMLLCAQEMNCGFWKESAGASCPFQRTRLPVKFLQLLERICCLHPNFLS